MDGFQLTIIAKAFTDRQWADDDSRRGHHVPTAEELDARRHLGWPGLAGKGFMAACANAMLSRRRPRASNRIESIALPPAEATAQV